MADGKVVIETDLDDSGAKSGLSKLGGTLGKIGGTALKGATVAIGAVSTAIVGLGASAIKYNATMEQYATSFEVMTGSAEKSEEVMTRLKDLGAATPFEFEDLAGATQTLMAFGFSADEAIDQFSILGDISQGDAEKLGTFSNALGKMQSSGKVSLESLNMMIEQGFNPLQVISEKTGESMTSLYDRVSKGTVSLDEIKDAMVTATSEGGQFYQSMDKQSQTLNGRISTLKDNFSQLTGAIFEGASSEAGGIIDMAINWIDQLQSAFEEGGVEALVTALGNILSQAVGQVASYAPKLIELAVSVLTAFIGGIQQNLPMIIQSVISIITSLTQGIIALLPQILQTGIQIIIQLALGLAQALPQLIPQAVDAILTLVDGLLDNIDSIIDAGIQLILGLAIGLINALPRLIEKAPEIILKLVTAITNNAPKLVSAALQIILALAKGLITSLPKLISQIPSLVVSIVKAFANMYSQYASIGLNIIKGIGSGLSSGWGWLKDQVANIALSLFNAAKNVLGIHSPSRKFAWIGEMSAEGMVKGFDENDPLKSIKNTLIKGTNDLSMGIDSYINTNVGGSLGSLSDTIVDAISNSSMTIKIGSKEMGRIVRSYA